jgi:hypothetical protein
VEGPHVVLQANQTFRASGVVSLDLASNGSTLTMSDGRAALSAAGNISVAAGRKPHQLFGSSLTIVAGDAINSAVGDVNNETGGALKIAGGAGMGSGSGGGVNVASGGSMSAWGRSGALDLMSGDVTQLGVTGDIRIATGACRPHPTRHA